MAPSKLSTTFIDAPEEVEPAATGCCGSLGQRDNAARHRERALAAMELVSVAPDRELPSCQRILSEMLESPWDIDVQLAGLEQLRSVPPRQLLSSPTTRVNSSAAHAECSLEQSSWVAPEGIHVVAAAHSQGYGRQTALDKDVLPARGSSGPRTSSALWPPADADVIDVLVHAMGLAPANAAVQEHAAIVLAAIATELVRGSWSRRRAGPTEVDAGTRAAMREDAKRLRARAFRAGVVGALVRAMRQHAGVVKVVHAVCLALWALCDGADATVSEGKQQAAAAGAIELIIAALRQRPPPLCVWYMGRIALITLVRDEPAIRRRANQALPKYSVSFSLWALSL